MDSLYNFVFFIFPILLFIKKYILVRIKIEVNLMYIVLILVVVLILVFYLMLTKAAKIHFQFDSEEMQFDFSMTWLSIFHLYIKNINLRTHICIYFFNMQIVSKFIDKKNKKTDMSVMQALKLQNTLVKTYYGLNEPHIVGILYGVMSIICSLIHVEVLEQYPNFIPEDEYLKFEAWSNLNIGKTLLGIYQNKILKRRKNYGSI